MPERKRRFAVYDVFSSKRLAGNPLAVVFDPDGLDDAAMQAIAGEFNLSETVFIWPPQNKAHRASVRIFTPMHELPFAGHPTVGAAIAITEAAGGDGAVDLRAGGKGRAGALRGVAAARTACLPNSTCRGCRSRWPSPPIRRRWRRRSASIAHEIGFENHVVYGLFRRRALHTGAGRRACRGRAGPVSTRAPGWS